MAASHVLLGFVCAFVVGGSGLPDGSGVGGLRSLRSVSPSSRSLGRDLLPEHSSRDLSILRDDVICIARREIGVREVGQNGGKRVSEYLAYTGIKFPAPYCASFVSWCFGQAGYKEPRTAWSPALFPRDRVVAPSFRTAGRNLLVRHSSRDLSSRRDDENLKGLVFGIYFPELKRIGHCGFVEMVRGEWVQTIEGNTGPEGGREGIGVFRRLRHKRTICKYSNWL